MKLEKIKNMNLDIKSTAERNLNSKIDLKEFESPVPLVKPY
jgi:hypothetical protein